MNKQIIQFLQQVYTDLSQERAISRKNELHDANRFNPFQFLTTNENGLSVVLAFLLNPNEKHGQGDFFLNSLLKNLKLYDFLTYEHVKVTLEKKVNTSRRRHDIFIEGFIGNQRIWILSIENKLRNAADQEKQIIDYMNDLKFQVKKYCLIYVPPFERTPSNSAITEDELKNALNNQEIKLWDANGLINWLEEVPIFAPKIRHFVEYFIKFLKEDVLGETMETNHLAQKITENQHNLDAALQVIAAQNEIYAILWNQLKEQLAQLCMEKYSSLNWQIVDEFNPAARYSGIGFENVTDGNDAASEGVAIEFGGTYFHNAYYGAWSVSEDIQEKLNDIHQEMGSGKSADWQFWRWCENDLRNWEITTWLRIPTGELAKEIFEKWQPLLDIFQEDSSS